MNNYIMKYQGHSMIEKYNNNNINIILCGTHNNRLECYFKSINDKNFQTKSFNNCVIIKCYKSNNQVKFNMIYEGEQHGNDKVSISSIRNGTWDIISFNNYFNSKSYDINLPMNTEIYLIRHALGVHNKMNIVQQIVNLKIDSELDIIGIEQAKRTGIFLKGYISNFYKQNSINFMASHLIRTQQTIGIIMTMLNIISPIYIVPCSHELIYSGDKHCDSLLIQKIPVASNIPKCRDNTNTCGIMTILSNINININWDYYMEFYKLNKKCQDTDIVSEIINMRYN
jgi:hypothetical protein